MKVVSLTAAAELQYIHTNFLEKIAFFSIKKIQNHSKVHKSFKVYRVHWMNLERLSLGQEIDGNKKCTLCEVILVTGKVCLWNKP